MTVVSDTTPLSELAKIGRLDLFPALFGSLDIPEEVIKELARHPLRPFIPVPDWARPVPLITPRRLQEMRRETSMGGGECAAILHALDTSAEVVLLDDLDARRYAERKGLFVTGTLGNVIRAKTSGLLVAARPVLDELIENGTWISRSLYEYVLRREGEL